MCVPLSRILFTKYTGVGKILLEITTDLYPGQNTRMEKMEKHNLHSLTTLLGAPLQPLVNTSIIQLHSSNSKHLGMYTWSR